MICRAHEITDRSIGARDRDRQRDATSVYDKVPLAPELTSIRRVGTCHFAPGARDGCTINVGSRAIDLIVLTGVTQHREIEAFPYACSMPISSAALARHPAAETELMW